MILIMGLDGLIQSIAWWCSGGIEWSELMKTSFWASQMGHVPWHGLHIIDCVFPTFLFIAGISFPYSYARQVERGDSSRTIHLRLVKRALILIGLGIVYSGFFQLNFPMRYGSVLGKIGYAWFFAALFYIHFKPRTRVVVAFGILLAYWLVMRFVPAPDAPPGAELYSAAGCFAGWVDRLVMPGVFYCKDAAGHSLLEPNGPVICTAAIPTAMFGMMAGDFVRSSRASGTRKVVTMLVAAAALAALGLLVSLSFPINKILWSPSFVLTVGGISLAFFAAFYWIMDVKGWRAWAFVFQVIGMNAIFVYLFQRIVHTHDVARFFVGGLVKYVSPPAGSCLVYFGNMAVCWFVLYFLYRKKAFFKV